MSSPPTAFARGSVRTILMMLQKRADEFISAMERLPPAMIEAASAGPSIRRSRAVDHVIDRLPILPLSRTPRTAVWRYPRPLDGVMMEAALLNAPDSPPLARTTFGIVYAGHALHRIVDRSAGTADPVLEMMTAHDALLALQVSQCEELYSLAEVTLPTPQGAFLCRPLPKKIGGTPLMIARTWIARDQLHIDQERRLEAWPRPLSAA